MEATMDERGRVALPQEVRDDLGLKPGMVLKIEEREGGILLKPLEETPHLVYEGSVLVYTGELQGDIESAVQKDREARSRKLAGLD